MKQLITQSGTYHPTDSMTVIVKLFHDATARAFIVDSQVVNANDPHPHVEHCTSRYEYTNSRGSVHANIGVRFTFALNTFDQLCADWLSQEIGRRAGTCQLLA